MGEAHANVMSACDEYHKRYRRYIYVTPKSYLSFLEGYCTLYTEKLFKTRELAESIKSGLQKINGAKEDVNRMKVMMDVMPHKHTGLSKSLCRYALTIHNDNHS